MSVEAISWALNLAPVPRDRGGQPSSACKFVLVGLANHAGPDGTGAFPSVATLVRYTGLSERTVRTCLDRLEAAGTIGPCDPDIVAARIKRADRRPQGWDLNLRQVRDDLEEAEPATGRTSARQVLLTGRLRRVHQDRGCGVQPPHPAAGPVDDRARGVQPVHLAAGTGCSRRPDGVQAARERGAAAAPEPYEEPPAEPSAFPARLAEVLPGDHDLPGGGRMDEFFDALGDAWRLTAAQRGRLGPAVAAALRAGWAPAELAAATGANIAGVRSRYAVLAARLSAAELPEPPRTVSPPPRPPWCGDCDQRTRRREAADGADAGRCPACHPLAGTAPRPGGGGPDAGRARRTAARRAGPGDDAVSAGPGEPALAAGEGVRRRG